MRAAGITRVDGDVVIDDRLFTPYSEWPDGLISPMWVNENLIDVEVTAGAAGQPATIAYRPVTAAYTVESQVQTVAKDTKNPTSLTITQTAPGRLVITGDITEGSIPQLRVYEVDDPSSFARTAFIEALQGAGVTVSASSTGANPTALLPAEGSYQPDEMLGEHVSADLAEFANLIMKVSYNRGADLMACLSAVKIGSKDCPDGVAEEVKTVTGFGIPKNGVFPQDGAGSDDQGRSTPLAMAQFYRKVRSTDYGDAFFDVAPGPRPQRHRRQRPREVAGRGQGEHEDGQPRRRHARGPGDRARQQLRGLHQGEERPEADVHDRGRQRADREYAGVLQGLRRSGRDDRRDPAALLTDLHVATRRVR